MNWIIAGYIGLIAAEIVMVIWLVKILKQVKRDQRKLKGEVFI